ncbi:ATP synthase F0 subcomplex subunit OSCP atp5 [Rhodotorula kratochvilovae]
MFSRRAVQAVRAYATQAASSTSPPIQIQGLAGKYAGALFTAAAKGNALSAVEADLKGLKATVGTDARIHDFLANPILSHADRAAGIDTLLKAASPKGASDLTRNLFTVLAENGRLYDTDKVIDGFLEIMSAHRGEVKVVVTSAVPLDKDLQKRIEDSLKSSQTAAAGKSLVIENRVSEAVLGGLVVDFGDKTIDLSVASRVARLNQQLQEGI